MASFKHQHDSCFPRQLTPLFQIDCLSFSGAGRSLIWGVDNVVEVIQIVSYFMVSERFLSEVFRGTFPRNYCLSFREPVPRGVVCFEVVKLSVSGTRPYVLCVERI